MTTKKLVNEMAHWLRVRDFVVDVRVRRKLDWGKSRRISKPGNYIVEFFTVSTKTRASTMASRVLCMANNVLLGKLQFSVESELAEGETPPKRREDLRRYRIFIEVEVPVYRGLPKRSGLAKAAAAASESGDF